MGASAIKCISKESDANWLKLDHAHDLILHFECLNTPFHYHTSNYDSSLQIGNFIDNLYNIHPLPPPPFTQ
jgi:hypothetical protein